jgi:hypothetical protein
MINRFNNIFGKPKDIVIVAGERNIVNSKNQLRGKDTEIYSERTVIRCI